MFSVDTDVQETSTCPINQSTADEAANNMHEMQQNREGLQAPTYIYTSLSDGGRGCTERERERERE